MEGLNGLLDFIKTPEGQGLLSGVFGYAANARKGTPWNNIGRGGIAGLMGYSNALDRQDQQAENQFQKQYRQMQMDEMQRKIDLQKGQDAWRAGLPGVLQQQTMVPNDAGPTAAPDTEAINKYLMDPRSPFADKLIEKRLFPEKPDFKVVGNSLVQVGADGVTPVYTQPEKVDPNKPFMWVDGKVVANPDYQQFELDKASRGASRTSVNIAAPEGEYNKIVAKGLGEQNLSAVEVARNAPEVVRNAQVIRDALNNGAITGTGAEYRLALEKALATAGLVGPGSAASTEALVSALGKTTLASIKTSGLGAGNGFTDKDRAFLEQAASGQITSTKENLLRVADLSERIARANYDKGNAILQDWNNNPSLRGFSRNTALDAMPEARPDQSVVRRPTPMLPGYKPALPTNGPKFLGFE